MTNTNTIKMTGIQEASDLTNYASFSLGQFAAVYYYPATGSVLAFLLPRGSRFALDETDCIYIDTYDSPRTAQELADNIRRTMDFIRS